MAMQLGNQERVLSEINVTPMVDVMLVLLVIFMVTAPLIKQGVPVALPDARGQPLAMQERQSVLSVTSERRVYLGEIEIPLAELKERLVGNLKLAHEGTLYLHADKTLPYGFVVEVMAMLREAGIENLGMVTDPMDVRPRERR